MKREDIIKLAREAGCKPFRSPDHWDDVQVFSTPDVLERFAALVAHAANTSQERVDEIVKQEHDRAVKLAQAYERGWNGALAQQEPVAWRWKERINGDFDNWVVTSSEPPPYATEKQPLYTTPSRKPLTYPQIHELDWPDGVAFEDILLFARAIESAHGIGDKA